MCNMSEGIRAEALKEGIEIGEARGEVIGEARGEARGEAKGQDMFATLVRKLLDAGRADDVRRVVDDKQERIRLMKEYGLIPS